MVDPFPLLLAISVIFDTIVIKISCLEFNRQFMGAKFSPYVKNAEGEIPIPKFSSYTFDDIKTMLEVVSTKFTRFYTLSADASNVTYIRNHTYYFDSLIMARAAEAAAIINRERNETSLTIIQGIRLDAVNNQTEMSVALEAVEKAREIYPGTVDSILIDTPDIDIIFDQATTALYWIRNVRRRTLVWSEPHLKVGFREYCGDFTKKYRNTKILDTSSKKLFRIQKELLIASDFVICYFAPSQNQFKYGAKYTVADRFLELLLMRVEIQKLNPKIEVMVETGWPSLGGQTWQNLNNLQDYWIEMNKFATKYRYYTLMEECFDNPWRVSQNFSRQHYGWWKLKRNDLIDNITGYVEKKYETKNIWENINETGTSPIPTTPNDQTLVYVGISTAIIFIFVICLFSVLYRRQKIIHDQVLTNKEIQEFKYGRIDNRANNDGVNEVLISALMLPYDKSLEIPKDMLEIREEKKIVNFVKENYSVGKIIYIIKLFILLLEHEHILGMGNFGCVYKALIKAEIEFEVALKTTKADRPTSVKEILSEIKILAYIGSHPNIVSICGAYTAEIRKGNVYLALELCHLGSLHTYLRSLAVALKGSGRYVCANDDLEGQSENSTLHNYNDLIRWTHEIARGMEFIGRKNVVHADLATRNILLTSDKTAKITDFGLSRRLYDYGNYVKRQYEPLPWRWMSVESLKRMEFSVKSDVWSYGVTIWEIFSLGDIPYPGLTWTVDFVESLQGGLRMKRPIYATYELYQKMLECWQLEPENRPTFSELMHFTKPDAS